MGNVVKDCQNRRISSSRPALILFLVTFKGIFLKRSRLTLIVCGPLIVLRARRELLLKKHPNHSDEIPLFLSQRGNGFSTASLRTLRCAFRSRLSNQYEIPFSYKFHDLRATYASFALMRLRALFQGHDYKAIEVLKSWMGHEDDRTLWAYITLLDADVALRAISLARENEIESYLNIENVHA